MLIKRLLTAVILIPLVIIIAVIKLDSSGVSLGHDNCSCH